MNSFDLKFRHNSLLDAQQQALQRFLHRRAEEKDATEAALLALDAAEIERQTIKETPADPSKSVETVQPRLVFDVGNTAIKGGFFVGDELIHDFRIERETFTQNVLQAILYLYQEKLTLSLEHFRVGIVTVVPSLTSLIAETVQETLNLSPFLLTNEATKPLKMGYATPQTLGTDRLAGAIGAFVRHGKKSDGTPRAVIVVDAGTAINYEVVSADGTYLGGAIAAGVDLTMKALARGTAQLPEVELFFPENPIGNSTKTCLQSGIMFAFADGVSGMVKRLSEALPKEDGDALVVATGGWAGRLLQHVGEIHIADPNLVLYGIDAMLSYAEMQD